MAVPLTSTGTNLKWYTTATGGSGTAIAPTPSTATVGTIPYYVSQTVNGCEGPRAIINVVVSPTATPPTVTSPVTYCQNASAAALTASGNNLLWYTAPTGGTGSPNPPVPSTTVAGSFNYYVSQSNNCGEGTRAVITVNITPTPASPLGLNVTGITLNAAVLNWTIIPGVYYSVDYKNSTSATWINAVSGVTTGTYTLLNLSPSAVYNWRVSANCSSQAANNYSISQFSTISHNSTITDIRYGLGIKISPNPISGNGIIDYIIPVEGTVTISLYNAQGQRLKQILSGAQTRGQYQLQITNEFKNISGGAYFLKLELDATSIYTEFIKQN